MTRLKLCVVQPLGAHRHLEVMLWVGRSQDAGVQLRIELPRQRPADARIARGDQRERIRRWLPLSAARGGGLAQHAPTTLAHSARRRLKAGWSVL